MRNRDGIVRKGTELTGILTEEIGFLSKLTTISTSKQRKGRICDHEVRVTYRTAL
jgi:hypothetical protein